MSFRSAYPTIVEGQLQQAATKISFSQLPYRWTGTMPKCLTKSFVRPLCNARWNTSHPASLAVGITSSHEQLFLATRHCRTVLFQTVQGILLNLVAKHGATKTKRNHLLPLHTVIGIPILGRHQAAKASKHENQPKLWQASLVNTTKVHNMGTRGNLMHG